MALISLATATATVVLPMPPGPTIVTNFCSASFIWIAARGSLRPSIRIKRAGSRDLEDGLKSPDVGEESDVTGTTKLYSRPGTFAIYLLPGSLRARVPRRGEM